MSSPAGRGGAFTPRPRPLRPASKEQGMERGQCCETPGVAPYPGGRVRPHLCRLMLTSCAQPTHPLPSLDETSRGSSPLSSSLQAPPPVSNHEKDKTVDILPNTQENCQCLISNSKANLRKCTRSEGTKESENEMQLRS